MIFHLRSISFFGRKCRILCQNNNGPCPLLAIANVLILQNRLSFHEDKSCVSLTELMSEVGDMIVEQTAKIATNNDCTRQQLLDSVLKVLPKLAKGLDLNVKFTGVSEYEFTEEISVFDALDIPLVHGWLLDPQDRSTAAVIQQNSSYNHLMFKLVEYKTLVDRLSAAPLTVDETKCEGKEDEKGSYARADEKDGYVLVHEDDTKDNDRANDSSAKKDNGKENEKHSSDKGTDKSTDKSSTGGLSTDDQELLRQGPIIETFLAETASQLTYAGLLALYQSVRERQLGIFFRNDHFSTIFSFDGKLYLLVTDLGYQHESSVVWELLDEIDGDTEYVNDTFAKPQPLSFASPDLVLVPAAAVVSASAPSSSASSSRVRPADTDTGAGGGPAPTVAAGPRPPSGADNEIDADLLLALQLQDEEEALHELRSRSRSVDRPAATPRVEAAGPARSDNDDFMSQFTSDQLDAMRAQEMEYRALAQGGGAQGGGAQHTAQSSAGTRAGSGAASGVAGAGAASGARGGSRPPPPQQRPQPRSSASSSSSSGSDCLIS